MAQQQNTSTPWVPDNPLPLQRIETIDEPRDREKAIQLGLFDEEAFRLKAHRDDFRSYLRSGETIFRCR